MIVPFCGSHRTLQIFQPCSSEKKNHISVKFLLVMTQIGDIRSQGLGSKSHLYLRNQLGNWVGVIFKIEAKVKLDIPKGRPKESSVSDRTAT